MKKFYGIIKREFSDCVSGREYLRDKVFVDRVLGRGSADFREPFEYQQNGSQKHLTVQEKVLLYCNYYFDMHYASSYAVYEMLFGDSKFVVKPVFIDFGCGPATSGVAFADFLQGRGFRYIGIDISPEMLKRADEFIGLCKVPERHFCENFDDLPSAVTEYSDTVAIINFSFSLAPDTFKGNFSDLCKSLKELTDKLKCSHYIVYQNPNLEKLHRNWERLKQQMESNNLGFSSIKGTPKLVPYNISKQVYCDILYRNKSWSL